MLLKNVKSWLEKLLKTSLLQNLDTLLKKLAKRELVVKMLLDDGEMQTRSCKALKHYYKELKMLLKDDETQTLGSKTFSILSK